MGEGEEGLPFSVVHVVVVHHVVVVVVVVLYTLPSLGEHNFFTPTGTRELGRDARVS